MRLWIGLIDAVPIEANKEQSGRGIFTTVVALAATSTSFVQSITRELEKLRYRLVDIDEVELFEQRKEKYQLTEELCHLACIAESGGDPQFTRFHSYPLDEDE